MQLYYSFVIPVYNRAHEVRELLDSMSRMDVQGLDFEVVIVEDGSSQTSEAVCNEFKNRLPISYYFKENSGPGLSRNYGMQKAKGNYFIILDSDVLIPPHYLRTVDDFLQKQFVDCYGGADAAHDSFTDVQKSINYVMTSFFTTGGIRGKEKSVTKFEPRSFNMGISKEVFETTLGFGKIHPGEDPDLSIRIEKEGFSTVFIPNAAVFHKRRIDWKKFKIQVNKFGKCRPILNLWHPNSFSVIFWFPSLFLLGGFLSVVLFLFQIYFLILIYLIYLSLIFLDSSRKNKSIKIGFLSVYATVIQFFGYGSGYLISFYQLRILKNKPEVAFPNLFF